MSDRSFEQADFREQWDEPSAATEPLNERELVFGYYDPGHVHLRQRGKATTLCGQRALDKPLSRRAVTCELCRGR